ncbi:MAG: cold-shock protein [Stappiaceae bacterium]
MDDRDSDRRSRGRRGGRRGGVREFGGPQDFGAPEGYGFPPEFQSDFVSERPKGGDRYGGQNDRGGYQGGGDRYGGGGNGAGGDRYGSGSDRDGSGGSRTGGYGGGDQAPAERGPRQLGTVKFFKSDKGFGFIKPDDGSADIFVHISAVERSGMTGLESDMRVSFETEPDRRGKGPKAVELKLADEDQSA